MNAAARPRRICFVAPQAYGVLTGDRSVKSVGGAEVQQVFIARELARRGHQVSMICLDHGQGDGIVVDGITVHRAHTPNGGLPAFRFIHPRLTSIWGAMRRANAEIYYQRAAGALTAFVVAFARRHHRASIFAGASDMDFVPSLPWIGLARDRALFRWGVRRASAVVVQTEQQRLASAEVWQRDAERINSCYGHVGAPAQFGGPVLWVGSVKALKQPLLFVELARACPEFRFRMIGGGADGDMAALREAAAGVQNLEVVGFVPFVDVERYFDGGSLLVNTSVSEGFPNTFLQAWARGMPSLSFFDAGHEHEGESVGVSVPTLADMIAALRSLKDDQTIWQARCSASKAAFAKHHAVGLVVDQYESLFTQLATP